MDTRPDDAGGSETPDEKETTRSLPMKRRGVLASMTGVATAGAGLGAFSGTAFAWDRFDVDYRGCSEVWMIVGDDLNYDPPTVAHVIVETADGGTDCRVVEFTEAAATTIPGQYGDAPVVKYAAGDGEKVLAVIYYNYRRDGRFDAPSCMVVNEHRCAETPNTADLYEADCVQAAYDGHWNGSYWDGEKCASSGDSDRDRSRGRGGGPPGRGRSGGRGD